MIRSSLVTIGCLFSYINIIWTPGMVEGLKIWGRKVIMWRTGASAAVFSKKMHAIWPDIYNPHPKISQMVALLSAHRFVMIKSFLVAIRCLFTLDVKL